METAKNGCIYSAPDPKTEYYCHQNIKSAGFNLLMKLVLLASEHRETDNSIKNYLKKFPDSINKQNDKGWTALMLAVANVNKYSTINTIKQLIVSKADPNIKNVNGTTALMMAVTDEYDNIEVIKLLLDGGVDQNIQDNNGQTALTMSIMNKVHIDKYYNFLIKNDMTVNIKDKFGNTPLIYAIKLYSGDKQTELITKLLQSKADANISNNNKDTAVTLFIDMYGPSVNDNILMKMLQVYNHNITDKAGNNVLLHILKKSKPFADQIMQQIISKVNINKQNNIGDTALMLTLENISSTTNIIDYILNSKCNVNIENKHGNTPILHAVSFYSGDSILFNKLVANGADLNHKNKSGATVIKHIIDNNDMLLAKEYVKNGGELTCNIFKYDKENDVTAYLKPFIIKYEYYKLQHKELTKIINKIIGSLNKQTTKKHNTIDSIVDDYIV